MQKRLTQLVLTASVESVGEEDVSIELHTKSIITGLFSNEMTLAGSADEWETFIRRIRKQLELHRRNSKESN